MLGSDLAEAALAERIQTAFLLRFGFESRVMVREESQFHEVVGGLPFRPEEIARAEAADPTVEHLHVLLSAAEAAGGNPREAGCRQRAGRQAFGTGECELYLLSEQSVRTAKGCDTDCPVLPGCDGPELENRAPATGDARGSLTNIGFRTIR